jgi:hypothetical protein
MVRQLLVAAASALALGSGLAASGTDDKPRVTLKASPAVGFSPLRVRLVAELTGGTDDYKDFYCAGVEWDWDDETTSETQQDCDPHEPGKSEIKRRYIIQHTFNMGGEFQVEFKLKQKGKVVGRGKTTVKVRPGLRDGVLARRSLSPV